MAQHATPISGAYNMDIREVQAALIDPRLLACG
jgi:hypothetical protein